MRCKARSFGGAGEILLAIAADMGFGRSDQEQADGSQETARTEASITIAAAEHGALRQIAGFDLVHLTAPSSVPCRPAS